MPGTVPATAVREVHQCISLADMFRYIRPAWRRSQYPSAAHKPDHFRRLFEDGHTCCTECIARIGFAGGHSREDHLT